MCPHGSRDQKLLGKCFPGVCCDRTPRKALALQAADSGLIPGTLKSFLETGQESSLSSESRMIPEHCWVGPKINENGPSLFFGAPLVLRSLEWRPRVPPVGFPCIRGGSHTSPGLLVKLLGALCRGDSSGSWVTGRKSWVMVSAGGSQLSTARFRGHHQLLCNAASPAPVGSGVCLRNEGGSKKGTIWLQTQGRPRGQC